MRAAAGQKRSSTSRHLPSRIAQDQNERVKGTVICFLLTIIVWIVFGQSASHEFINYDDGEYVTNNAHVLNGLNRADFVWAFTTGHTGYAHPVTWLTHQLDCQLYGTWAGGHHLTNVIIHTVNVILLFFLFWRLTSSLWPSAFLAALFAVHPLHVESVAWVAERKDVLSGLFFLLTLHAYVSYVGRRQIWPYLLALFLFALGILAKPMLVTLPCILLLLDYWPLSRTTSSPGERNPADRFSLRWLILEKLPFGLITVAGSLLTFFVQKEYEAVVDKLELSRRIGNALISYMMYVWKTFWPQDLAPFYPYPKTLSLGLAITSFLLLISVSALGIVKRRSAPYLITGWFWYLGMLVPVIGLIQVGTQARADRYTYLPQIGLGLMVTWGMMHWLGRSPPGRRGLAVAGALIIACLTALSTLQASYWKNSEIIWSHALASKADSYVAHNNLAAALAKAGQTDQAIVQFQEAVDNMPFNFDAHNNLGKALMLKGRTDEAIIHFREGLKNCDDCSGLYVNLGHALARKGEWAEAVTAYQSAIRSGSQTPNAHNNNDLGIALARVGQTQEALEQFREALRIDRSYREAHCNLALVLAQNGQRDEAIAHLRDALRLKPDDPQAKAQLRQLGLEQ